MLELALSLFLTMFSKAFFFRVFKTGDCVVKVLDLEAEIKIGFNWCNLSLKRYKTLLWDIEKLYSKEILLAKTLISV